MIKRFFNPLDLLDKNKSILLFGPRGTGKTALINSLLAELDASQSTRTLQIDLLQGGDFLRYLHSPEHLTKEVSEIVSKLSQGQRIVICIDEVQKVPPLLDEVHHLIEKYKNKVVFLLSGSSARKLKRGGANLLAGRALSYQLFPLSQLEEDLSLSRALQLGTMPGVYLDNSGLEIETLESYVSTYLREEIQQESLVRGVERFARFLEFAAQNNGQPVNYSKLAKHLGAAPKTVIEYYSILSDTLISTAIPGWSESIKRQLLQAPKHYFFDCGVVNALNGYLRIDLRNGGYVHGNLFETLIVNQLLSANQYCSLGLRFYYWRDKDGREIDLVLARNIFEPVLAIEIKSGVRPSTEDCPGFAPFREEYPRVPLLCVCDTPRGYSEGGIKFLPWKELVTNLAKFCSL